MIDHFCAAAKQASPQHVHDGCVIACPPTAHSALQPTETCHSPLTTSQHLCLSHPFVALLLLLHHPHPSHYYHPSSPPTLAAYIEARVAARVRSSSQLRKQQWHVPKFVFEFGGAVVPLLLLVMSVAPAEPAFLLLFLLWGSLALKLWMRLAHGPAARQHMAHMLQHMTCTRKRYVCVLGLGGAPFSK